MKTIRTGLANAIWFLSTGLYLIAIIIGLFSDFLDAIERHVRGKHAAEINLPDA